MKLNLPTRILPLLLVISMAFTVGCAKQTHETGQSTSIGPYSNFSGRLIVMEPKRRWQVVIQWRADRPDRGDVRLTHAATGTVVEFRWSGSHMQVRDSNARFWKVISADQLGSHGIVMPPQQLASILLGNMPSNFTETKPDLWESRNSGQAIRLQWYASSNRLVMTDIKKGRQATLIISP